MDLYPSFEYELGHEFHRGEAVYIIDRNDYDIWEARVKKCGPKRILVSCDDEIDNNQWIKTKRVLVQSEVNIAIFREQERIREAKRLRDSEFENEVLENAEENEEALLEEEKRQRTEFDKWMIWVNGILTKHSVCLVEDEIPSELSLPEVVNTP
jgi:hypothetical protein